MNFDNKDYSIAQNCAYGRYMNEHCKSALPVSGVLS